MYNKAWTRKKISPIGFIVIERMSKHDGDAMDKPFQSPYPLIAMQFREPGACWKLLYIPAPILHVYVPTVKHDSNAIYGTWEAMIYVQLKSLNVVDVKNYLLVNDLML